MIPLRIQITNFMNHRSSDIDCSFKSALIVARDKNNDRKSNGIGKTTIFSAIEYALFGEVPTSTIDKIVRDDADKCCVVFDFSLDNEKYRIVRARSKQGRSELELYQWSNTWTKISGTRIPEAEKKISELIRINHKAFVHSVKFAQNDLNGLASKKPDGRREILKEPLQLTDYVKLDKIASKKTSDVRKSIDRADATYQMLGDPTADIKAAEVEFQICETTIKSKETSIAKLLITLEEKKTSLSDLKKTLGATDSQIHDTIVQQNKRYKDIKAKTEKYNEQVQKNSKEIEQSAFRVSSLKVTQGQLTEALANINSQGQRELSVIQADIDKVCQDELYGTKLLAKLEVEYDQANKNIPNGDVCPHCLQPITPEHRQKCEEENTKILADKSKQIVSTKSNLTKCQNKKTKLQTELFQARNIVQLKSETEHKLAAAKNELVIITKAVAEAEKRLFEASKEAEVAQSELLEITKNLAALKDAAHKSSVADLNTKIFAFSDEIKVYERSIENVRSELADAQKRHGAAQEKLKKGKENLEKQKSIKLELVTFRQKLKIHQLVTNAFSPRGIPTFIIFTIVDELQAETNMWLSKLRPELELEFDRELEMYFKVNGIHREYTQLSIGQQVYIALALKLGLSVVIQKKLGIQIGFLELDEVDQSLDKDGVEAFADVVKKLQNEFKVFVITHNDELKDKFSHCVLVEGDGKNGASARTVTTW